MHLSRQLAAKLSAALMAVATVIVPAMAADVGTVTSDTGLNLRAEANTNAAVLATVGAVALGIPMGIYSAVKQYSLFDYGGMVVAMLLFSVPAFWLGIMCQILFCLILGWLPAAGDESLRYFILPSIVLGANTFASMIRMARTSMLDVIKQDYIRTARAKGLSEVRVIFGHAMRNALIPVITVLGPTVANLMTGSFVIEKIFAIPGLGGYLVNSVSQRDYTTIMGVTIFYATFLMVMIFVVDIFYCLIDPRIKYE